jgi:hypothetical protein
MAITYTPLATTTLGSNAASYTFSSISGSYTDLILVSRTSLNGSAVRSLALRFNSDTGSNYSYTRMFGDGSVGHSDRETNLTYGVYAIGSSERTSTITHINNYSNTTTFKTLLGRGGYTGSGYVSIFASLWRSTAAITSITLLGSTSSANFSVGSTFNLYGILAGNA